MVVASLPLSSFSDSGENSIEYDTVGNSDFSWEYKSRQYSINLSLDYDTYPVSDHHCLIIPKRHVKDYFDLSNEELIACNNLIKIIKKEIVDKDKTVKGFNLGTNIGKIAGQSIMHCHFHLIPRREGDVEFPQGGVRSVIPQKQHYKRKI